MVSEDSSDPPTSGLRLKSAIWNLTGEKKPIQTACMG